ncbi:sensor histidine kinase [Herbaspirillum sp. alder98]|uniref:sensor histidine kinase n=1 Tax=Herbaspirillum sp. alder98 TaxID=2913096 RepID=UPI001CD8F47E|nr:histidine kinase [Herbaspirillum sp. alder98]MCA1324847.1 histidine kinase [Herbaspirillum sp. alder98]
MNRLDTSIPPRLILLLRELLFALLPTVAVNLLCALAVTTLMHIGPGFYENLMLAMCIGLLTMVLINGFRVAIWGDDKPAWIGFLALLAVLAPASLLLGRALSARILEQPIVWWPLAGSDGVTGVLVLISLVSVGAAIFFWNRDNAASALANASEVEKHAVQAQLQMLQAQIEPHLLFDTLSTLQTLIGAEPLRAQHMLNQLNLFMRTTLATSRNDSTTLKKEFDLIGAYLGLMSLRMGLRLSYTLQLPEHLGRLRLAPMLLQPLVENAIKHGLEPKADGGNCTVRAALHQDLLVLSVFDTGVGLASGAALNQPAPRAGLGVVGRKEPKIGQHFGLEHIRERVSTLYGPLAELIITHNVPAGTMAQIAIPLKSLKSVHRNPAGRRTPAN